MRQVYADLQVGGRRRRRAPVQRDLDLSGAREEAEGVDLTEFPRGVQHKFQKRMAQEEARRAKAEVSITDAAEEARPALEAKETAQRAKVEAKLERDLLKAQARYAPLRQLGPIAAQLGLADVSNLSVVREAGRLLKSCNRELVARAKSEAKLVKLAGNPEKQAQEAAKEEARQAKAMTKLQGELAKRVGRSANPSWWHRFKK